MREPRAWREAGAWQQERERAVGWAERVTAELWLRRKWRLRAHGKQVVFVKRRNERAEHVLMKALLWALYLPAYPDLLVEVPVGDRYKPDLVALDANGEPVFWGEAGQVGRRKIRSLVRRYRGTHLALAKWATPLDPLVGEVEAALAGLRRDAACDLLSFPAASAERFVDTQGEIQIAHRDVAWVRLG